MLPDDPRHGERRGYYAHRRDGEKACDVCKRAVAAVEARRQMNLAAGRPGRLSPLGTHRRLQALAALGYDWSTIGREIDWQPAQVTQLFDRTYVFASTAAKIAAVYERLSTRLPDESTPGRRRAASRARNIAKRKGWLPPIWWDDLDDPDERPRDRARSHGEGEWEDYIDHAVVWRVCNEPSRRRPRKLTRAESQEVVRVLLARGVSTHVMRDLYGIKAERFVTLSERTAS